MYLINYFTKKGKVVCLKIDNDEDLKSNMSSLTLLLIKGDIISIDVEKL